jgi:glycosyltransferase involved in cell wall biosynthesis
MISVIVCTYNRSESLRKTLSSLAQLWAPAGTPWELIVVDNNSTDDTAEVVKTFAAAASFSVRYVCEINQGLSHARNSGIEEARGDIIAFTDDDVTVDPRWLRELQKIFDQFGCIGVGGRIFPVWIGQKPSWLDSWLERDSSHSLRSGTVMSFDYGEKPCELGTSPVVGANMAFKKTAFENYGVFRTDLGKRGNDPMIGEETEFCTRLSRAGHKLIYAPGAVVYHLVPKARVKKSHFQSHYFNWGRYTARVNGFPKNAKRYFGVPRYLFRSLLVHLCSWLFAFDPPRRFRCKLQVCESLGEISEARRISIEGK